MQGRGVIVLFGLLFAIVSEQGPGRAQGTTPSFTISAGNATISASGTGSIPFTLTSVNGFVGSIAVSCGPANPPSGSFLPQCGYTGGGAVAAPPYSLTANGTVTGSLNLVSYIPPCSNPCPVKMPRGPSHRRAASLALAGALVIGLGIRWKAMCRPMLTWIAFGALAVLAGMSACGGGNTLTPGTFAYTVTASQAGAITCSANACTALTANTTVNVTVPAGISTNLPSANP